MSEESQQLTSDQIAKQYRKILQYALKLTADEDDAKDLAQDVTIHAIEHRHQFAPGTNLNAWLGTMTKNLFINQYRRRQKWANPVDIADAVNWVSTPETVYKELEVEHFDAALNRVRESDRRCLQMRREGYSYEETAEVENIPVGTVRSRLFRGRNQLEKMLLKTGQPMNTKANRVNYTEILSLLCKRLEGRSEESPVIITNGSLAREADVSDMTIILALNALAEQGIVGRRKAVNANVWEYWQRKDVESLTGDTLRGWVSAKSKESVKSRPVRDTKPAFLPEPRIVSPKTPVTPQIYGYFVDGSLHWLQEGASRDDVVNVAKSECRGGLEVIIVQKIGRIAAEPVVTLY